MTCKWQVEIDDYARRVLAKHWPDVRRHDDVRTFPPEPIEEWKVDVICGGFPCQDISYAGKGAGLAGERSGLFYELARVVRVLGPRIVVLENVAALLTRGLDAVLGTLASLGYDAEWECLPAAAFGAPHIRDRVFILAYAAGERCRKAWERGEQQAERARFSGEVLADSQSFGSGERQEYSRRTWIDFDSFERRRHRWEIEPELGRVANGIPHRAHRLRGLGNAVVPQVAEYVGRCIMQASEVSG